MVSQETILMTGGIATLIALHIMNACIGTASYGRNARPTAFLMVVASFAALSCMVYAGYKVFKDSPVAAFLTLPAAAFAFYGLEIARRKENEKQGYSGEENMLFS